MKEYKDRRIQLLMKPSVYRNGKREAEKRGISFNEYVSQLIEHDTDKSMNSLAIEMIKDLRKRGYIA